MFRILICIYSFWLSQPVLADSLEKVFEKAKFNLGGHAIDVYVADDEHKRERGLMFVEKIPENTGMLFVFEYERVLGFWMKNTLIPLSIGFFDQSGKLVDIQDMKVPPSMMSQAIPSYQSRTSAQYALEMNSGWFAKRKIKQGARLQLVSKAKSALLQGSSLVNTAPPRQ